MLIIKNLLKVVTNLFNKMDARMKKNPENINISSTQNKTNFQPLDYLNKY